AVGFEQERDIDERHFRAGSAGPGEKFAPGLAHQGMHDRFEPHQRLAVADDAGGKELAVDPALFRYTRKNGFDRGRGFSFVKTVHFGVGVKDGHPLLREHFRGGGLPHADGTREPKHDHRLALRARSLATSARSSGVTSGRTPNQRSKAGAAWCNNIPSPSTTGLPRARAVFRSSVSSGA